MLPCPILQYANDTLILTHEDTMSMEIHKEILDEFSLVIGLTINFHKRTLFPMHIAVEITNAMA
jgi:hypothetical protein